MSLVDKIRQARRINIKVGKITFTGTRATVEQALTYGAKRTPDADICRIHINGWEGVKESDLIDVGSADAVSFDKELFHEIIGEKQDWWKEIAKEVLRDAYDRVDKRKENEKK